MFRRTFKTLLGSAAVAAFTAMVIPATSAAHAAFAVTTPPSISFAHSADGSTAGLLPRVNPAPAALHVATVSGFAQILINNPGVSLNTMPAPTVTDTVNGVGGQRLEIAPVIGADSVNNDATGYAQPSLCAHPINGVCWALGSAPNTYTATWTQVQQEINEKGGVKAVYFVADGSLTTPYTTEVTSLIWNGTTLLSQQVPDVLTASYVCGTSYANRVWRVSNVNEGGRVVSFAYSIRLASGAVLPIGSALVDVSSSVLVATHRGVGPLFVRWSSLGHAFTTKAYVPAHQVACS